MRIFEAHKIAQDLLKKLSPHCEICEIAGSVRRRKSEVKDIEIVCSPNLVDSNDMFSLVREVSPDFHKAVQNTGKILWGKPSGRYVKIELTEGIKLDLFIPQKHDYYRIFAMRTGSADYSAKVIARAWVAKNWVGTEYGLRLRKDCIEQKTKEGSTWFCPDNKNAAKPPVWKSEMEFFDWLELQWIKPELREIKN